MQTKYQLSCSRSDQFEALQEELDRRRQECLQLKVFPREQLKEHPWYFSIGGKGY